VAQDPRADQEAAAEFVSPQPRTCAGAGQREKNLVDIATQLFGDWDGQPAKAASRELVFVAARG
jgi:hypothetical protein